MQVVPLPSVAAHAAFVRQRPSRDDYGAGSDDATAATHVPFLLLRAATGAELALWIAHLQLHGASLHLLPNSSIPAASRSHTTGAGFGFESAASAKSPQSRTNQDVAEYR